MKDSYGREVNYLRISLTEKCNLRCVYCKDEDFKMEEIEEDTLDVEGFKTIIKNFAKLGINKVKFLGGDPLLYPYIKELIYFAKFECNIEDISITTNGHNFCQNAIELKECGLDRVNLSIDSLKEYRYDGITRGGNLKEVLNALNVCQRLKIPVKINCVLIEDFNTDEIGDFIRLAKYNKIDVRFVELSPYGSSKWLCESNYVNPRLLVESLVEVDENDYEDESITRYYNIENLKGRVGVICPSDCGFCSNCNKIMITHDGFMKLCVFDDEKIDLKYFLDKPLSFEEKIKEILKRKPEAHTLV